MELKRSRYIHQIGFTLIELIIVMLIIGILSGVLFTILRGPMTQFIQVEQRANLVDIAETALLRMTREIRLALPNSIRLSGTTAIEFLRTKEGGRYRAKPGGPAAICPGGNPPAQDVLRFSANTDCFEILGTLNTVPVSNAGSTQATCRSAGNTSDCLVIYNTGQPSNCAAATEPCSNAYCGCNMAGIIAATNNYIEFDIGGGPLLPAAATRFPYRSPRQRFQIVDMPVSFVCNSPIITRYADYDIQTAQPTTGANFATAIENNLLINRVDSCTFTYDPGTASRAGLVTLSITVRDNDLGQEVTLLQQAHVDNQP
jgi:MSHA biogenesis protein MshO